MKEIKLFYADIKFFQHESIFQSTLVSSKIKGGFSGKLMHELAIFSQSAINAQ